MFSKILLGLFLVSCLFVPSVAQAQQKTQAQIDAEAMLVLAVDFQGRADTRHWSAFSYQNEAMYKLCVSYQKIADAETYLLGEEYTQAQVDQMLNSVRYRWEYASGQYDSGDSYLNNGITAFEAGDSAMSSYGMRAMMNMWGQALDFVTTAKGAYEDSNRLFGPDVYTGACQRYNSCKSLCTSILTDCATLMGE